MAEPGATYICAIFETRVLLGRIGSMNLKRVEATIERLPGPEGELLDQWQTGTRAELQATFPEILEADQVWDDADETYRKNPQLQIEFERPDL